MRLTNEEREAVREEIERLATEEGEEVDMLSTDIEPASADWLRVVRERRRRRREKESGNDST